MRARDPRELGRAATPLELFFDLVVVVAIAFAAERLHHALVDGVGFEALVSYGLVFFGVWWAWASFTWFASGYDTDDVVYRLSVFVIMTGALVLAAGVPQVFDDRDFTLAVLGYVVMRVALVTQWLRVARDEAERRSMAYRFAGGVVACQVGWLSLLLPMQIWPIAWIVLVPAELMVPFWASRARGLSFHPEHLAERYGLFMIIVLGESVLAASLALQNVMDGADLTLELGAVFLGSLLILYGMWWVYFDRPEEHMMDSAPTALVWSYLHLPILAAVAAVGAGLVVAIEEVAGHAHIGRTGVGAAVGVPLGTYLLGLRLLYLQIPLRDLHGVTVIVAAMLVFAAILTPAPVLAMGVVLSGLVATKVTLRLRTPEPTLR